jgi:hypothetical protein
MSAPRDLDRLLRSFLSEGPMELPDPSYDEVRDRMEHTRQRAFIGSWRTPDMNRYLKMGLAAAAAVVIAVVGFNLLPGSPTPGEEPSASPSVSPSVAEPSTEPSAAGGLPVGPHQVLYAVGVQRGQMTVTIPAPGWFGEENGGTLAKNESPDPPDGAGLTIFANGQLFADIQDYYVYGDACHWQSTTPDTPATTVDAFAAALQGQALRDASAPVDITLDGYTGKAITLHVPDDAVISQCDSGYFGSFAVNDNQTPARYHQGPGQIDKLWIVDVGGDLVVIDIGYFPATPQSVVDELEAIVASMTFE